VAGHFRTEPPFDVLSPQNGYGHFRGLPIEKAEQLLAERFLDPDEGQEFSPPALVFLDFMRRFPGVTAHGYLIGPDREDYRVTIEGVAYQGPISAAMLWFTTRKSYWAPSTPHTLTIARPGEERAAQAPVR
jgi:hypothetical protein